MKPDFTVFIVDDSDCDCTILESALSKKGRVESFATAEDCANV